MPLLLPLPQNNNSLVLPRELALMLGVSLSTLERWRCEGNGPQFLKIGRRRVGYRASDILRWLNTKEMAHTGQVPKPHSEARATPRGG